MAGFFKRRRAPAGPNKNQQKVLRGQETDRLEKSLESLTRRHPSLEKLVISVEFYSAQNHLLDQQTRAFGPEDGCDFIFPCSGECGTGAINLGSAIDQLVAANQSYLETAVKCQERLYAGPRNICGCEIRYKIDASYISQ